MLYYAPTAHIVDRTRLSIFHHCVPFGRNDWLYLLVQAVD